LFTKLKNQAQGNQMGYPILQNISFEVNPSDRLVIVGAPGAGKTSLLRLIHRLTEPNSGKIYLDDQDYSQIPVIQLRQQIASVQQEIRLLGMTVEEALAYPLVLRGLSGQLIRDRISYYREKLQIPDEWLTRTEVQLSSGQRQLVAIARALVVEAKILILDEPTSALDTSTSAHLMEILTQICQTQSITVLMVNHQIDLAQEFCTRLLYLQAGQVLVNQSSNQINWVSLKTELIKKANQAVEEWS
jgi:D-methionine transport system ATP-binding protein